MSKQTIFLGQTANDRTGDPLRVAFEKVNENFDELYAQTGDDIQIPAQATHTGKVLTTNGTALSWGTVSYTSLTDKPTIPPTYTLPTATTSVLGGVKVDGTTVTITDGVISSVGGSGATNKLVNGLNEVILDVNGALTFPNGLLKIAGNKIRNVNESVGLIAGSEIEVTVAKTVISNGLTDTEGPSDQHIFEVGSTRIFSAHQVINTLGDGEGGPSLTGQQLTELTSTGFQIGQRVINDPGGEGEPLTSFSGWTFGTVDLSQALTYPNTALQRDTAPVTCTGNASTVVYTALGQFQHTIRLLIQVEGTVGAAVDWDTQACEMIIAKSFRANALAASVYGVVHTSVAPLATFTANWNALTSRVEVLCTAPSANDVYVRIFATEITTSD